MFRQLAKLRLFFCDCEILGFFLSTASLFDNSKLELLLLAGPAVVWLVIRTSEGNGYRKVLS